MSDSMETPMGVGREFGAGPDIPSLPASILEKIQEARRLLGEIGQELGMDPLGPGGGPMLPPGAIPGKLIPKSEIDAILNAIYGDIFLLRRPIRIWGVEMTQAIQTFTRDLQGTSSSEGDNAVPLVANKDLLLRVYAEIGPGFIGYSLKQVTGQVSFGGQDFGPLNGPIALQPGDQVRRSNWNHTLNFRIPAALCRGNRTFKVRVFDPTATGDFAGRATVTGTFSASFRDVPPMRVMGAMVHFTGNNLDLAAPSGLNLVETLARILPMLPTHGFDFGPCVNMDYSGDLQTKEGWDGLLTAVANLRSSSTLFAYWVGLLPANISAQVGATTRGIGRTGVAVSGRDDTRALSHELGHATTLGHVDAGGAPGPFDTKYPTYGSFPFGSIGEVGVNVARQTLFNPATTQDLMTYSDSANVLFPASTWISPYHYRKMMNALVATDGTGTIQAIVSIESRAMMMNLRVYRDGRIELLPSYAVTGVAPRAWDRPTRAVMLDLLRRDGKVLGSYRCHEHNPYQDPDGAYLDFHEVLPWSDEVARVAVVRGRDVIGTIEVAERAPELRLGELRRDSRDGNLVRLEWTAGAADGPPHALVRYSHDDGRTWLALAQGVTEGRHLVNLGLLPGGEKCRLEVIVASGLQASSARTEPFAVPRKPRAAYIVSPRDGEVFRAGSTVALLGGGYSPDGGTCDFDEVAWHSNLDGLLGSGWQVIRSDLRPGTHRITLTLPDGARGVATAGVWIKVADESVDARECLPTEGREPHGRGAEPQAL